jgi:hypothetical protein
MQNITYILRTWTEIVKRVSSRNAMQNYHLHPEDTDRDCQLKVNKECRNITYFLKTWTQIVKMVSMKCRTITYSLMTWTEIVEMVSSRLAGNAELSLTS